MIRSAIVPIGLETEHSERLVHRLRTDAAAGRRALVAGLREEPASIAPKYFYDALGAALFGAICELPEYYLTRAERAIFTRHRTDIAAAVGRGKQLVDLGAGDCAKAAGWLPFLAPSRYVAVDIAADVLRVSLARLAAEFPDLDVAGIVTDFTQGLELRSELARGPLTFFYPGSSIGNFAPDQASAFLVDVRRHCATARGSGLLIGVDTRKDAARLEAAYADRLGVTAAFNRNILLHVNRVLGCDFEPDSFAHEAHYDARHGRIEMHLTATRDMMVHIDGVPRPFLAGERIHTENSYKYSVPQFQDVAREAAWMPRRVWTDAEQQFSVHELISQ